MNTLRLLVVGVILGSILAGPAQADIAARYETTGDDTVVKMEMTVEADEHGNVRTQMARLGSYFLLRDGELYQVSIGESGPFVVRVSDLMTVQAELAEEILTDGAPEMEIPLQLFAEMETEVVGERVGTGYGLVSDEYPEPRYASVVISHDPELAQLGEALVKSNEAMTKTTSAWGQMGTMLGVMNAQMLEILRKGAPLRMMQLELTDVSDEKIPPERFALPAEPLTIEEIRARVMPRVEAPPTLPPLRD